MEVRRPSTVLGCGCALVITLFLTVVLGVTLAAYRAGKRLDELAADPAAAATAVGRVLPFRPLPADYRAFGTLSVPWTFQVAFLLGTADGPPAPSDLERVDRGFVFVRVRDWLARGDRTRTWMTAGAGDAQPIEQQGLDFSPGPVVGRGRLHSGAAAVTWLARRGEIRIDARHFGGSGEGGVVADRAPRPAAGDDGPGGAAAAGRPARPAVLTLLSIDCGDDPYERFALWFAPDPSPARPVAETDWSGTPGDGAALADFLARLDLCA